MDPTATRNTSIYYQQSIVGQQKEYKYTNNFPDALL